MCTHTCIHIYTWYSTETVAFGSKTYVPIVPFFFSESAPWGTLRLAISIHELKRGKVVFVCCFVSSFFFPLECADGLRVLRLWATIVCGLKLLVYEALIYEWNAQMGFRYPATVRVAAGGTQLAGVALIGVEKKINLLALLVVRCQYWRLRVSHTNSWCGACHAPCFLLAFTCTQVQILTLFNVLALLVQKYEYWR